jgi:VanZ family protein
MATGAETGRRLAMVLFVLAVCVTLVLSLLPPSQLPAGSVNDKLAHAVTHAALAMLWLFGRRRPQLLPAFVGLGLLGLLVEGLQSLTGYRHAEVLDVVANLAGTASGCLLWYLAIGHRN